VPFSPASKARARDLDRALDADRADRDKNRDAADQQLRPSHGDKTLDHPNTNNRRVGR
jgi:hypothetical protein